MPGERLYIFMVRSFRPPVVTGLEHGPLYTHVSAVALLHSLGTYSEAQASDNSHPVSLLEDKKTY